MSLATGQGTYLSPLWHLRTVVLYGIKVGRVQDNPLECRKKVGFVLLI